MSSTPLVGIMCNKRPHEMDWLQIVNHTYLESVARYMQVQPVLIPAPLSPDDVFDSAALLDRLDGLLMTGNRSNLHPSHYGQAAQPAHEPFDELRDMAALPLIKTAIGRNMPMLAICRGMQELNVACGGSLVAELPDMADGFNHRTPDGTCHEDIYVARQDVAFPENGYFAQLLGVGEAKINSLHRQAIDQIGNRLKIEAIGRDGVVEAVSHEDCRFCIGVQWHPELQFGENIISAPLFADFNRAIYAYSNDTEKQQ